MNTFSPSLNCFSSKLFSHPDTLSNKLSTNIFSFSHDIFLCLSGISLYEQNLQIFPASLMKMMKFYLFSVLFIGICLVNNCGGDVSTGKPVDGMIENTHQSTPPAPETTEDPVKRREFVCSQEKSEGPCKDTLVRYYYDKESNKCKEYLYSGCFASDNNFETMEACEELCVIKS
ncbi:uncharacterized protein LOC141855447 [Brevipalpus obovatus]|uniref:uncharacterized protein LOC141855447 n=1 Tax=Brevipalpus obovatus TaxID=246614 RepID=UPI003D9E8DA4